MRARGFHLAILAIVLFYAAPISSHAAVVNGGFDTGTFAGWDAIGDTSVQTASVGISPTHGCCMALLTTITSGVPFSTHSAANGVIGSFLGYSFSEIQNIPVAYPPHNEPYFEGQSAIKQTVQGHAGEFLSFDAYWVTNEILVGLDGGVLSLVPSTTGPKVLLFLSPPNFQGTPVTVSPSPVPLCEHENGGPCPPGFPFFSRTTGWQHFDVLLPSTDTFTIGFAVWNTVDSLLASALFIDNVQLRVPQASTAALLLVGLLGLLFSRRWILRAK